MLGLKNFNVTLSKFGWLQKMILYPVLNSEVLFHILKNIIIFVLFNLLGFNFINKSLEA